MSIRETLEKIKPIYPVLLIVILASIFFALGRISALKEQNEPLKVAQAETTQTSNVINSVVESNTKVGTTTQNQGGLPAQAGEVIGSKSGKKYYFPWCGTVKRIKPENQVHFNSIEDAKKAGFTAGGNCKGLQ